MLIIEQPHNVSCPSFILISISVSPFLFLPDYSGPFHPYLYFASAIYTPQPRSGCRRTQGSTQHRRLSYRRTQSSTQHTRLSCRRTQGITQHGGFPADGPKAALSTGGFPADRPKAALSTGGFLQTDPRHHSARKAFLQTEQLPQLIFLYAPSSNRPKWEAGGLGNLLTGRFLNTNNNECIKPIFIITFNNSQFLKINLCMATHANRFQTIQFILKQQ